MNTPRTRKAQLTIFIVIGMLIALTFIALLYLFNNDKQPQGIITNNIETKRVYDYVTNCLKDLSEQTIIELGQQGGVIDFTPYKLNTDYIQTKDGTNVKYGITKPQGTLYQVFTSTVPDYPWTTYPENVTDPTNPVNTYDVSGAPLNLGTDVLPTINRGSKTIYDEIKATITTRVKGQCTNFNTFEREGYTITYDASKITTNITIAERELFVTITLALNLKKGDTAGEITKPFTISIPVKLEQLYNTANALIHNDITNMTFNTALVNTINTMDILLQKDITSTGDDIIILSSPQMKIQGRPYRFQFARQNRAPALHYAHPENIRNKQFCQNLSITQPNNNHLIIRGGNGYFNDITLNADDPDENTITFDATINNKPLTNFQRTSGDNFLVGNYNLTITASDGHLTDWQNIPFTVIGGTSCD